MKRLAGALLIVMAAACGPSQPANPNVLVVGIQSAEKPPRYVPFAKVRAVMKTAKIETPEVAPPEATARVPVARLYKPEAAAGAQMIEGSPEEVTDKIVGVLAERSLI